VKIILLLLSACRLISVTLATGLHCLLTRQEIKAQNRQKLAYNVQLCKTHTHTHIPRLASSTAEVDKMKMSCTQSSDGEEIENLVRKTGKMGT